MKLFRVRINFVHILQLIQRFKQSVQIPLLRFGNGDAVFGDPLEAGEFYFFGNRVFNFF